MNTQLVVLLAAVAVVWVRTRGREAWHRQTNPRLHPAVRSRFAAAAMTVVAGAAIVTGMAVTAGPKPERPRADLIRIFDPNTGSNAATFTLFNPVPGRADRPPPLTVSAASF